MNLRLPHLSLPLALILLLVAALPAAAHQPFFEEEDIEVDTPWRIADPTVSTVVYATLESSQDIDTFAFDGKAGQRILLEITIPQIEGQEEFAPTMALMGPGLSRADVPSSLDWMPGVGAIVLSPPPGPPTTFFEPFSRTSYWERQSARVPLPESGRYTVAVWDPDGQVGRYGFVIGDKERMGGDLLGLATKFPAYWTPVEAPAEGEEAHPAGHGDHDHGEHEHLDETPAPVPTSPAMQWWQFGKRYGDRH